MAATGGSRVALARVPCATLDVDGFEPVDVLACALGILLDATGRSDATVVASSPSSTWRWTFDPSSTARSTIDLLATRPEPSPAPDTEADATVRWLDGRDDQMVDASGRNLELTAHVENGEVELALTHADADADIDALLEIVVQIVSEIAADPHRRGDSIQLVSPRLQQWLVDDVQGAWMEYPSAATVDALVRQVAEEVPDELAVVDGDRVLTYGELVARADEVADRLRAEGAPPGAAIGVMFGRGLECVTAMLGVLFAGGVYVPIPIEDPETRQQQLLELAGVGWLLRRDAHRQIEVVRRPGVGRVVPATREDEPGWSPIYVMFTSGSTGEPKAVVVAHRSVIRLIRDPAFVGFARGDVVAFASNPGFDATSWEVWGALCSGARLVTVDQEHLMQPEQLEELLRAEDVSCMFLTTSLFNSHARAAPTIFSGLRALGIGGEAADPAMCRRLLECGAPPRALLNAYGPTEAATFASWHEIAHVAPDAIRVPIGRPVVNTSLHVLDRHRRLLPPGVPGELFIGGDAPALGYLGDAELTAAKFVPDPFAGAPQRLYATGDLVVRDTDGTIVYLGRRDDQVKIRGFRVELRGVEAAIRRVPGVSTAVVIPHADDAHQRLVAYVIVAAGGPTAAAIRKRLRADLPEYLVPSRVVILDELPLTRNGKLDRAALPNPFAAGTSIDDEAVPSDERDREMDDELARSLADLWCGVLGTDHVDADDSFFDAGGDSLLAVRLYGAVRRRFGVVLSGGIVNEELTFAAFTREVRRALTEVAPPVVTELTTVQGPPVVLIPAAGGELFGYRWLVRALGDQFRLVGVREPGHYATERRPRTLPQLSTACLKALHDAGVEHPVAVIGECTGGVLAHALACDLGRDGPGPGLVALLDAPIPGERTSPVILRGPVRTVLDRTHNAIALIGMRAQWTWCRLRHVPMSPTLAHRLTARTNAYRVLRARPSFFPGRELYVQAVSEDGTVETAGAPEYWLDHATTGEVVEVTGAHAGDDSYLSRARVQETADVLARELAKVCGGDEP